MAGCKSHQRSMAFHYRLLVFFIDCRKKQKFLWNKSFYTRNLSDTFDERPRAWPAGTSATTIIFLFVIRENLTKFSAKRRSRAHALCGHTPSRHAPRAVSGHVTNGLCDPRADVRTAVDCLTTGDHRVRASDDGVGRHPRPLHYESIEIRSGEADSRVSDGLHAAC
ncbi:hypothetical protein EVAR_49251_1 [Eumeta japonica]|uniref:Uncharacterized protein n=1 Tax=Eumeta variegata TaxID=151549 RepID=A0A4C1YG66_EUMVA|nr:hypothetical protein EVAR_49251_1 [Eumeta japonica]